MNTSKNKAQAAGAQVAQHTPGPWKVIDGIGCGTIYSIQAENPPAGNGVLAAVLHAPDKQRPLAIAQANARLIAAAPELLEALKECRPWVRRWSGASGLLAMVDNAVAKAGGKL